MKNLTNEELLSISIDKCCYPEIYDELSSRLARVSELEAHLRQETARLNHADKRIEELEKEVEEWKHTAAAEAAGLESWKRNCEEAEKEEEKRIDEVVNLLAQRFENGKRIKELEAQLEYENALQNIRLFNNAGMSFPECYAYQKLLDTDKGRLRMSGDKNEVTCPKCLKKLNKKEK